MTVVGAGPSGLTCAFFLARSGRRVVVCEARERVGARFHGNFQGLENWSSEQVLRAIHKYVRDDVLPRFTGFF